MAIINVFSFLKKHTRTPVYLVLESRKKLIKDDRKVPVVESRSRSYVRALEKSSSAFNGIGKSFFVVEIHLFECHENAFSL